MLSLELELRFDVLDEGSVVNEFGKKEGVKYFALLVIEMLERFLLVIFLSRIIFGNRVRVYIYIMKF